MLELLGRRCAPFADRLQMRRGDARTYVVEGQPDLVVTHFFLDCLTELEVRELVARVRPRVAMNALWLVSEFRVPEGWLRVPARVFIRGLYLAFRLLTGLRVTRLPEYAEALRQSGFEVLEERQFLGGLLVSEIWVLSAGSEQ
jgi:hypothetical protein